MTVGFFCLYFPNRNAQNLRRIKQRKGFCFFQASSDNKNDQDDGRITPYTFQDFRTEVQLPQQNTPVEACVPICKPFQKKSEKYPPQGIQGLNRRFQRKCFSSYAMHPYAQNLRRIKQRKEALLHSGNE